LTVLVATTALPVNAQSMRAPSPAPSAFPSPSPSPSPTSTPQQPLENPLVTERIRREFLAWQGGRIDRATYSPDAGGTYDDALVASTRPVLVDVGTPNAIIYRETSLLLGDYVYRYDVTGTTGWVSVLYSIDANGKTDGIVFTPQVFRTPAPPGP
jgi:hypothetical protein